jgi:hypothetical protein
MADFKISDKTDLPVPVGTEKILVEDTGGTYKSVEIDNLPSGGGGGSTEPNPSWVAGEFDYPTSNPAPLDTLVLTNGIIKQQNFDDTVNEKDIQMFKVPSDIDTSGTVTFIVISKTEAVTTNNMIFNLNHSSAGDNEDPDVAFTIESSGAKAVNGSGKLDYNTWTETVANLGWAANDLCRIELERDAVNASDNVVGDINVLYYEIDIPRV